jgi:hypothetical protein
MAKVIVKLQLWELVGLMAKVFIKMRPLWFASLGWCFCDLIVDEIGGCALRLLRPLSQ